MYISVTVMTTASVVTALLEVATTFSGVYIAVTLVLSNVTALSLSSSLHRCQFTSIY